MPCAIRDPDRRCQINLASRPRRHPCHAVTAKIRRKINQAAYGKTHDQTPALAGGQPHGSQDADTKTNCVSFWRWCRLNLLSRPVNSGSRSINPIAVRPFNDHNKAHRHRLFIAPNRLMVVPQVLGVVPARQSRAAQRWTLWHGEFENSSIHTKKRRDVRLFNNDNEPNKYHFQKLVTDHCGQAIWLSVRFSVDQAMVALKSTSAPPKWLPYLHKTLISSFKERNKSSSSSYAFVMQIFLSAK